VRKLITAGMSPEELSALKAKIWVRVDRNGLEARPGLGPCHLWTGPLSDPYRGGYGRVYVAGRQVNVTILVLELEGRPLGEGKFALHHCDVSPCVRLDHLYEGTHADNARDREARGRRRGHYESEESRRLRLEAAAIDTVIGNE